MTSPIARREFLVATGAAVGLATLPGAGKVWASPAATASPTATPESLVKLLYESLSPGQKEAVCFAWDHVDGDRGLLRTHVSNNWDITPHTLNSDFYTKDQRALVRAIFEGIYSPEWHERIDKQLTDDSGGFGESNSLAIFGTPGEGPGGKEPFEFVFTGRHMTVRCDGNSAEHVAFGGPIFYGHDADGFYERPNHPGSVFWPQGVAANELYRMLDGEQQQAALVRKGLPHESRVAFRGAAPKKPYQGIAVGELSADQQANLRNVLAKLVEPYRDADRSEAMACLDKQSLDGRTGLAACHLAYYAQEDIGEDGVWDNWRLEGPSFVWHYRGAPHVHVWVNVADDPGVELNAAG
jgi:hypothetical protein